MNETTTILWIIIIIMAWFGLGFVTFDEWVNKWIEARKKTLQSFNLTYNDHLVI